MTMALLAACDVGEPIAASAAPETGSALHFRGLCDASAVAPLADDLFVVAGDEDNALRVYSSTQPGLPVYSADLSAFLQADPKRPEVDLEAAARRDKQIFWISSHGRNASGKERLGRHRLFATTITGSGNATRVEPMGKPYADLLQDLLNAPQLSTFRLAEASGLPPKARNGLNIEGLAFTPEGHLLIGFRNPIPRGKALLVRLMNPSEVINGQRAEIGPATLLDLGGLGIRSLEALHDGYLIIAGGYDGSGTSSLYRWKHGAAAPEAVIEADLLKLNPEAATILGNGKLLILSDDGTRKIGGRDCKKLQDPSQRMYRAVVMNWPGA
jgi:hypothetical protein